MRTAFLLVLCLGFVTPSQPRAAQAASCPEWKRKIGAEARLCSMLGSATPAVLDAATRTSLEPESPPKAAIPDGQDPPKPVEAAKPQSKIPDADSVKTKLDEELRLHGTSAEEVNRAIDRGAAYLAAHYLKNEFQGDEDYLGAYALIHTNQYFSNGKLRDKINAFLRGDRWQKSGAAVYVSALRALALEASHDPDLRVLTRECAEYLVESQGPKGTWTYKADVPITPVAPAKAPESGLSISGGEPLDEEVKGELVERKNISKNAADGDTSCTQFAILGLHAAARCGYAVPKGVWEKCLKEMESRHCKDGGWHYHGSTTQSYGSMTCAGICTVALCRFYMGEKDYLNHPMLQSGLDWLAKNFAVDKNPNENQWALYYLYSVERVGVFAATDRIGEHAWYGKGAKFLVGSQTGDGSWVGASEGKERGTGFALLFLTRATSPVRQIKRGGNGWLETHALNDSSNFMIILDASGSMRDEIDGREKFDIAKDVVESIIRKLGEGAQVGLRVYGHRLDALQENADFDSELLVPLGPLQPATFMAKVRPLRCKGKTPLTFSMDETIKDIARVDPELDLITIILTDGGESTRGAKPAGAAARLASARKGMKIHVVGFDINDDDEREQLEKIAASGGGKYFQAKRSSDLMASLALATVGAAEYQLKDKTGKEVFRGKVGDRHELPEGKYTIAVEADGRKEEHTVWINTEVVSHATLSLGKFLKKSP
jgi:hypothetical protein